MFLSHLSGDEEALIDAALIEQFLSHLSGDEDELSKAETQGDFLSHLSGDEGLRVLVLRYR